MGDACASCGTALPAGAAFCPECGSAALQPMTGLPVGPPRGPPVPPHTHPYPAAAVPAEPDSGGAARNITAGAVGLSGALLVGVVSFLPWAAITHSFLTARTQTVSGWDWFDHGVETGPHFAVLALLAAALAGLLISQVAPLAVRMTMVAVGALSLGLAAYAMSDILDRKGKVQTLGDVDVTLRYGLWVLGIGAVMILVAGVVARQRP